MHRWIRTFLIACLALVCGVCATLKAHGHLTDGAGRTSLRAKVLEQMPNTLPIALFTYNWNNSGSMNWEFAAPLPHSNSVPTRTMTYDDDNRLATVNGTSVTMDLDGNLISGPTTNSAFSTYTYDARNRLVSFWLIFVIRAT